MASLGVDEKRRLIRRLLDQEGRGLAEACGFPVTNNPSNLFAVLCLAMLAAGRDYRHAVTLAQAVRQRWESAARLAGAPERRRVEAVRDAGAARDADRLAGTLAELAQAVVDRYHGDLRRLRTEAGHDPARERRALTALPGIDDHAVDLFFQEVQVIWTELAPFAEHRALRAAQRLGLADKVDDLVPLTGDESEKLAWLAGALLRVDQDNAYPEVQRLAVAVRRA